MVYSWTIHGYEFQESRVGLGLNLKNPNPNPRVKLLLFYFFTFLIGRGVRLLRHVRLLRGIWYILSSIFTTKNTHSSMITCTMLWYCEPTYQHVDDSCNLFIQVTHYTSRYPHPHLSP